MLYCYGDSWTEGVGVNRTIEDTFSTSEDRKIFRNQYSWPKKLSEKLSINYENRGIAGASNKTIFDTIVNDVKLKKILEGDLVVILWSSSLRDTVTFFPNDEWFAWGKNYINSEFIKYWNIGKKLTNDPIYNDFLVEFKMFYVNEIFNQNYYNIVNQNYIIFLQKLFSHFNINYVMADAFDKMVFDLDSKDDKTKYIDKDFYWNFSTKTFKDYLIEFKNDNVWEDNLPYDSMAGKHPSIKGYGEMANEFYNFIHNSGVLNIKQTTKFKLF